MDSQLTQAAVDDPDAQRIIDTIASQARGDENLRSRLETNPHEALRGAGLSDEAIALAVSRLGAEPEVEGHGMNRKSLMAWAPAAAILSGRALGGGTPWLSNDSVVVSSAFRESQAPPSSPAIFSGHQRRHRLALRFR